MVEQQYDFTKFFDMLDTHFDEQIKKVDYDKTILCTITNADNAEQGEYTVTDGSSHFLAYSADKKYKKNDNVYVLIPEGDFNATKQIIGKHTSADDKSITYISPFENYFDITGNLFNSTGRVGLLANDTEASTEETFNIRIGEEESSFPVERMIKGTLYHYLGTYDGDELSGFERLGVKADFESFTPQAITGDYGIELGISYTDKDGADGFTTVRLNSTDMWGNPYNFGSPFTQEQVFDISNYNTIKTIVAYFYETPNFYTSFEDKLPCYINEETKEKLPDNLFVDNVYISLGYETYNEEKLTLYTRDTTTYSGKNTDDQNKKTLHLRWSHILPDVNKTCVAISRYGKTADEDSSVLKYITNYEGDGRAVKVHYYVYDKNSFDALAGQYWKEILNEDNSFEYSFIPDVNKPNYYFKAIIELTDEKGIKQLDEVNKTALDKAEKLLTEYTQELNSYLEKEKDLKQKRDLAASIDAGNFAVYDEQLSKIENLIKEKNKQIESVKKAANKINSDYSKYITKISTDLLEFTCETDTPEQGAVDYVNGLGIQIIDNQKGVYRIYDTLTNNLVNGVDEYTYRTARMIFTSIMASNAYSGDISQVRWYIPKKNTMIVTPEFGRTYNTEDADETFQETEDWYIITRTGAKAINATAGDSYSTIHGTTDQQFRIKRHLLQSSTNNTIKCEITRNGIVYPAQVELVFGNSGSNGTDNTVILKLDEEWMANGKYKFLQNIKDLSDEAKDALVNDYKVLDTTTGKPSFDVRTTYYYKDEDGIFRPYIYSTEEDWKKFLEKNTVYKNDVQYISKSVENKWTIPADHKDHAREWEIKTFTVPNNHNIQIVYVKADVDCCDKKYENYVAPEVYLRYTDLNDQVQSIVVQRHNDVAGQTWGVWPTAEDRNQKVIAKHGTPVTLVSAGDSRNGRRLSYIYDGATIIYTYTELQENPEFEYKIYKYNGKDFIDTGRTYMNSFSWTETNKALKMVEQSPPAWTGSGDEDGTTHYIKLSAELYNSKDELQDLSKSNIRWSFFEQGGKPINPGGFRLSKSKEGEGSDVEWHLYKGLNGLNAGCILKCEIEFKIEGDYPTIYTGYLPVAWRSDYNLNFSGADRIIYNTAGSTPTYYREPFLLNNIKPTITPHYMVADNTKTVDTTYNSTMYWLPKITDAGIISPPSMFFNDECYNYWLDLEISGSRLWAQPILILQNAWASSVLNQWDGSLTFDETKGTILSTMVGAGSKNSSNQFNGVLMGNVKDGAGDTGAGHGIYGYKDGVQAFGLLTNGTAFLGKKGRAQLEFDGEHGTIQNSAYVNNNGMRIDFDGKDGNGSFIDMKRSGDSFEVIKLVDKRNPNTAEGERDYKTFSFATGIKYYANKECSEEVGITLSDKNYTSYNGTTVFAYGKVRNDSTKYDSKKTYYTDKDCTTLASTPLTADLYNEDRTKYYYKYKGIDPIGEYNSALTYYSDVDCTEIAQGPVKEENFVSGAWWYKGVGLAENFNPDAVYYVDKELKTPATGALNSENIKEYSTVYYVSGDRVLPKTDWIAVKDKTLYSDAQCTQEATARINAENKQDNVTYYWQELSPIESATTIFEEGKTYYDENGNVAQGRITYDTYESGKYYQKETSYHYEYQEISKDTEHDPNTTYYQKILSTYIEIKFSTSKQFQETLQEQNIYIKNKVEDISYPSVIIEKIEKNRKKINDITFYTDNTGTQIAQGNITVDNYKETEKYYEYVLREDIGANIEFKDNITYYLDKELLNPAMGKVTQSTFNPDFSTYYTWNIKKVAGVNIVFDSNMNYYSKEPNPLDLKANLITSGIINNLNFIPYQWYTEAVPQIALTFVEGIIYYTDETCKTEAQGKICLTNYIADTYYVTYAKQCDTENFNSNIEYFSDVELRNKAMANWSSEPLTLYYIISETIQTANNKWSENFDSRLKYYTNENRTIEALIPITEKTYGQNLPYYVQCCIPAEGDFNSAKKYYWDIFGQQPANITTKEEYNANKSNLKMQKSYNTRVKISTESPFFQIQNRSGIKVMSVDDNGAKIGGWTLSDDKLYDGSTFLYSKDQLNGKPIAGSESKNNWRIAVGSRFGVDKDGKLYASEGVFSGHISSKSGDIGGWIINPNSLSAHGITLNSDGSINSNNKFKVNRSGNLYAENAYVSGTIESSNGHIGSWTITDNTLSAGKITLNASDGSINSNNKFIVDKWGNLTAGYAKVTGGTIGGCKIENGTLQITNANISGTLSADKIAINVTVHGQSLNLPNAMQTYANILAQYGDLITDLQDDIDRLERRVSSLESKGNNSFWPF